MTFTFASGFVVGAFMVGALASLLLPTGVFISLAIWLSRSSRRFSERRSGQPPVATPASTPGQMSAQSATAPPAQAPPAAQAPPPARARHPRRPLPPRPGGAQDTPGETPPDTPEPGVR